MILRCFLYLGESSENGEKRDCNPAELTTSQEIKQNLLAGIEAYLYFHDIAI
jgi:hypothetical protein